MASTATGMERGGWRNQARRLALVPIAAATEFALVDPPPQSPPPLQRTDDSPAPPQSSPAPNWRGRGLEQSEAGLDASDLAALRQLVAVKTTAAKMLNERIRKLTAEGTAKDKRIAELEDHLFSAREDLAHSDNENHSLRASLDLTLGESARLSGRVWDTGVEADALKAQVESAKLALRAVESERDRLTAAVQETKELRRVEADFLNSQIEAVATRAAAAEDMLAEARRSLAARTEESKESLHKAMEAALLRNAAADALREVRASLQAREFEVREFERSRAALMAQVGALLEAFEARAAALAAAEDKAKSLELRVAEAEVKAASHAGANARTEARIAAALSQIDSLNLQRQSQQSTPVTAAEAEHIAISLVRRVEDAETRSALAESEIESLNAKLHSQEAALAEAVDAVQSLVKQAANAEDNSRAAQSAMQDLNVELQHEQARRAIAEVALSKFETEAVRLRNEVNRLRMSDEKIDAKRTEAEVEPEPPAVICSAQSLLAATISL